MAKQTRNVIILTSGLSGSSVLTGLISRAGYWTGDETHKKEYDTYENEQLIQLNLEIFRQVNYTGNYAMEFSPEAIARIASLGKKIDDRPFRQFVRTCEEHGPWIWKDPRLWLTIRYWKDLLPLEDCRFILLTRNLVNSWVSSTLRRHIRSYQSLKQYEQSIEKSLVAFLTEQKAPYLHLTFENLVVRPEETIRELNKYLETELTLPDLQATYHKPLYRIPRSSPLDYLKALLIYAKNYSERVA
jgi:hypothetical protein